MKDYEIKDGWIIRYVPVTPKEALQALADTPRTDAEERKHQNDTGMYNPLAKLARQLERELNNEKRLVEELILAKDGFRDDHARLSWLDDQDTETANLIFAQSGNGDLREVVDAWMNGSANISDSELLDWLICLVNDYGVNGLKTRVKWADVSGCFTRERIRAAMKGGAE